MSVITAEIYSNMLNQYTTIRAIIPVDSENGITRKPLKTLYLLHGVKSGLNDWIHLSSIIELAYKHSIAIIMPQGDNDFYIDYEKNEKRLGQFIGRELVEITRALFPLSEKYEDTYIGGISVGGYGALRNGLKYNKTFSKIIAFSSVIVTSNLQMHDDDSPSFFLRKSFLRTVFGDWDKLSETENDLNTLINKVKNETGSLPPIYFACGSQDVFIDSNREYYALAKNLGSNCVFNELEGDHNWRFWNAVLEGSIEWAAQN